VNSQAPTLDLPRVALGAGNFGGIGSASGFFGLGQDENQAFALMDRAWELGITHFDTADAYGGGRSETMIGRWITARRVRPTITTKTFNPMRAGADHGLAPARVALQLSTSLERLGLDHVELYLAHDFDPDVALEDTFTAFDAARDAGRIGAYGVSNFDHAQLARALDAGSPAVVQNGRNLLERDDDEVLELCAARGVAYLAFGPLSGGWLTGKYRRGQPFPPGSRMTQRPEIYQRLVSDSIFAVLERLEAHATARGSSLAGLALAWLLDDPRVTQIVLGPSEPEHLDPLGEALSHPLAPDERSHIESLVSAC